MRTVTDTDGRTLTYDYDDLDRVRVVTYPDASYEQYDYEDHSLVAVRDRAGRWTRHYYDVLMQRVATRDPLGGRSLRRTSTSSATTALSRRRLDTDIVSCPPDVWPYRERGLVRGRSSPSSPGWRRQPSTRSMPRQRRVQKFAHRPLAFGATTHNISELEPGDEIVIVLHFEHAGEVKIKVRARVFSD